MLRYGKWEAPDGTARPEAQHTKPPLDDDVQVTSDAVLASLVSKDVHRGLVDRRDTLQQSADAMRETMTDRLERLRAAAWERALKGSAPHVAQCRYIDEQLARLHGLNKPIKHEVTAPEATTMVEQAVKDLMELFDKHEPEGALPFTPRVLGEN